MPTNPKTGTCSPLVMSTMFLFWKLTEIDKHLRDCTQNIIWFAQAHARRLDFVEHPTMTPQDFVREWNALVAEDQRALDNYYYDLGDGIHDQEMVKRCIADLRPIVDIGKKMMPWFAEDLCGKEFAEQVQRQREIKFDPFYLTGWTNDAGVIPSFNLENYLEDQFGPSPNRCGHLPGKIIPGLKTPASFLPDNPDSEATAEWQSPNHSSGCHPFLSNAPPLGNPTEEAGPGDYAGFTKNGEPQWESPNHCECQ
ncbi:MAG: hypothetical protein AAB389_01995 [Patescibacteria group bacterium]